MKKTVSLVVALFLLTATLSSFATTDETLSPYASAEYSGTRTYRFLQPVPVQQKVLDNGGLILLT